MATYLVDYENVHHSGLLGMEALSEDKTYEMPKSADTYRKPRRLSEEQREAARERARGLNY